MVVAGGVSYSLCAAVAAGGANKAVEGERVAVVLSLLVNLRTTGVVFTTDDVIAPTEITPKGSPADMVATAFVVLVAAITVL